MSVLSQAYEEQALTAAKARERLQALLPPVPDGMRWLDVIELATHAGYQIRLFDDVTQLGFSGTIAYTFVDAVIAAEPEALRRTLRMKTHGWVEHLLMYRPWADVMKLVREVKSYYFWQEHGAQLRDDDDEEDDETS